MTRERFHADTRLISEAPRFRAVDEFGERDRSYPKDAYRRFERSPADVPTPAIRPMTDPWDDAVLAGTGLSATFVRRLVVVALRQPMPYQPADWRDALVIVDRGELEVECLGGTRQHFGPGAVICLEDLPLRELRSRGEEPVLLVAISRRATHGASGSD